MILLKLIGHEYLNEVSDIIKLFYGKTTICLYESKEFKPKMGDILITSKILKHDDLTSFISNYIYFGEKSKERYNFTYNKKGNIEEKKEIKHGLKISMYKLLSEINNKNMPWGILTGIRPVKIVHQLLEAGMSDDEVIEHIQSKYYVRKDRADLAVKIARTERKYVNKNNNQLVSLYFGIPFCPSRCNYCSFTSNLINKNIELVQPYLDALLLEIKEVSRYLKTKGVKAQSLYIGGGTPTSISAKELEILIESINYYWEGKEEFTCEAGRPDTIDLYKLKVLKELGITRLSINPQTMDDDTLVRIGRKHTNEQIIESFYLARSIGFDNINMDIIIGLPGEGLEHIAKTVNWINYLDPENVTVHTLAIKRASKYNEAYPKSGLFYEKNDVIQMMELAKNRLEANGYYPYYLYRQKYMAENLENIGFCKKNKECIYNIQIMEEKQSIIAFGADAVTKVYFPEENRLERQHNIKDIKLYIDNIDRQINKKITLLDKLY